jgi:hypothetical protein
VEEERHLQDHPRHQEAEEDPRIPHPMTDDFTGVGQDGRAMLV